jgi:hypothetical protein
MAAVSVEAQQVILDIQGPAPLLLLLRPAHQLQVGGHRPAAVLTHYNNNNDNAVLRIRIRDPCLFDPWIRDPGWVKNQDPGSGMGKKSGSGSWMNNPDQISESLETIFGVKMLKYFDVDPGWKEFGTGINIPDPQQCNNGNIMLSSSAFNLCVQEHHIPVSSIFYQSFRIFF